MKIAISVIIPVYNVESYLSECLDTLINQTLKNIEIIAIDDKSTDNSYEILKEYAKKDSRIIVLKNPYNIGAARTRNIGIQLARGKYLSILDSDDFFEPDFLEKMFDESERTNADITYCSIFRYNNNLKTNKIFYRIPPFLKNKVSRPFNAKQIPNLIFNIFGIVPFNKLILRTWLLDTGIAFQDLPNSNDVYFGLAVLIHARYISYLDMPLIHKRMGWGGNIENKRNKKPLSPYKAEKKFYEHLKSNPNFKIYYPSFYSNVTNSFWYMLTLVSENAQKKIKYFLQEKGFPSLDMTNLSPLDFSNLQCFLRWQFINRPDTIITEDEKVMFQDIYVNFFNELKNNNLKVAVWGYGNEGSFFVNMAQNYGYNLIEVYDKDKNKHQLKPIPVKYFSERNKDVNTVIVLSNDFAEEITDEIKNEDNNIKIFDFIIYRNYGISFNECERL